MLFLTLKTFSATGGIEKVCRVAGKAMNEYALAHDEKLTVFSMYDGRKTDPAPYFHSSVFKGFGAGKISFVLNSWKAGIKSRVVVLSHVNLLLAGFLIKVFAPHTRLVLIAHGIEVWAPPSFLKRYFFKKVDLVVPVSTFTRDKMIALFHLPENRFRVINNCLDPFLPPPADRKSRMEWREKFQIGPDDRVLMTLSRLSKSEKNKGYDKILYSMRDLKTGFPSIKYLFVGKYDQAEKSRLEALIEALGLEGKVIFTGFVPDRELSFYYNMADIYIMPSEKEGFGISFIEAMYYGLPVIAGDRDGTRDALLDGKLGTMVDPGSQKNITAAIREVAGNTGHYVPDVEIVKHHFGYEGYRHKWHLALDSWK